MQFPDPPAQWRGSIPASPDWHTPPAQPRLVLTGNDIHVWRALLSCEEAVIRRLEASLSPDEKSRAGRFVFPRDRDHFIAGRGILRVLLGTYLRRPAAEVGLAYEPGGKPVLRPGGPDPPIRFNLSHAYGVAVYAFAIGREVGVDVEAVRPDGTDDEIAERFFSPREIAELRSLPHELRHEGFFLCWTRKEAYIKARGRGLRIPLDSFDVSLTPGKPEELRSTDHDRWSLRSLQPAPGYVGAVVAEGKDWGMRLWDWAGWKMAISDS